ncbi:hypothetical protein COOONC_02150 [Cooperia oncophora]
MVIVTWLKRRRPILLGVVVLLLLFLTLIGVLLFFLFRPAKTEDDIEYFHQEVKSPSVDFDNVDQIKPSVITSGVTASGIASTSTAPPVTIRGTSVSSYENASDASGNTLVSNSVT